MEEELEKLEELILEFQDDISGRHHEREIRECVMMKFGNSQITSAQRTADKVEPKITRERLAEAWGLGIGDSARLIGAGVRFRPLK